MLLCRVPQKGLSSITRQVIATKQNSCLLLGCTQKQAQFPSFLYYWELLTIDTVHKPRDSECYTPSSEPFKFFSNRTELTDSDWGQLDTFSSHSTWSEQLYSLLRVLQATGYTNAKGTALITASKHRNTLVCHQSWGYGDEILTHMWDF
jgi:hypothetical protein